MVKPPRLRSAYDHWYQLRRWRKRREYQLRSHPHCAMCEKQRGLIVPATCVDHITPHNGNFYAFEYGPLQSLCDGCHSSDKRTIERHGFSRTIGADGYPVDPNHPAYRSDRSNLKLKHGEGGTSGSKGS